MCRNMQSSPWTDTKVTKENIVDNSQVKPIKLSVYATDKFRLFSKNKECSVQRRWDEAAN